MSITACMLKVWDYNRKKLFPIRAKERAGDLIDLDDQMAATEVRPSPRAVRIKVRKQDLSARLLSL